MLHSYPIHLFRRPQKQDPRVKPSVLTIGNFDGLHQGHLLLIKQVTHLAKVLNISPSILTFTPHPRTFFAQRDHRPELIPTQVSNLRNKVQTLSELGIEQLFIKPFNQKLSKYTAEDFIEKILIDECKTQHLIVGSDFRFGHHREGTVEHLEQASKKWGFNLTIFEKLIDQHHSEECRAFSSTQLRKYLAFAQLDQYERATGRHYRISGHVVHGKKLGQRIGFPTLNVGLSPYCALRSGVYIVYVHHSCSDRPIPAVASLGVRPTVACNGRLLLEVHLLNQDIDAYGQIVDVDFLQFIRDEEKFNSITELQQAIANDVSIANYYFKDIQNG